MVKHFKGEHADTPKFKLASRRENGGYSYVDGSI